MDLPALRSAVTQLTSLPDAKALRDKAVAIEIYAKQAKLAGGIERQAAEIKLRAERRIGELLRGTVRRGGAKSQRATLPAGISKTQSSRWQLLARLPAAEFETALAKRPSTAAILKVARQHVRTSAARRGPDTGGNIYTGDLLNLDCEPDLILTDPPYADLACYERLGEFAASRLKPNSLCVAYCGLFNLPQVLAALAKHLTYYWVFSVLYEGHCNQLVHTRTIQGAWKPIVAFAKGKPEHDWLKDVITGSKPEKSLHIWQQPESEAAYLIKRLSLPGQLVCDPFCGSGTVLAAAKSAGRRWVGCDIDPLAAKSARKRVA